MGMLLVERWAINFVDWLGWVGFGLSLYEYNLVFVFAMTSHTTASEVTKKAEKRDQE